MDWEQQRERIDKEVQAWLDRVYEEMGLVEHVVELLKESISLADFNERLNQYMESRDYPWDKEFLDSFIGGVLIFVM